RNHVLIILLVAVLAQLEAGLYFVDRYLEAHYSLHLRLEKIGWQTLNRVTGVYIGAAFVPIDQSFDQFVHFRRVGDQPWLSVNVDSNTVPGWNVHMVIPTRRH